MKVLLAILLVVLASDQFASGYRILGVFPLHGKSHWVMMGELMKGLARRGHQVDVVGHFPLKTPIPNYRDIVISGPIEQVINNVTAEDIKRFDGFNMKFFVEMTGDKVCALLERPEFKNIIDNPHPTPKYDVVITELFASPCFLAFGRHVNAPVVGAITAAIHDWHFKHTGTPLNHAFIPSLFSTYSQRMTFWQRVINTIQTNLITYQIDYYTNQQYETVNKLFNMNLTSIHELYKDLSLVLVNSHHSLHGIKPLPPAVVDVGGLHVTHDENPLPPAVQKWLDESKDGCVFFTFGSMVRIETFPKEVVETFYKAFEKISPVRVLMKVAKKEDLLPGLPKNVMVQPWFPQVAVLKHPNTKAFITHGGLMGTQESIYAAVPMVGIPLFGDQHVNIQTYVNKNVAVSLGKVENVTVDGMANALKTVLHDPVYRKSIKRLSELFADRPMNAMDTAVYWVEYVARHGNILQSPEIYLTWWERNLLDVYGFMILCVLAVLGIVIIVLRGLKRLLFGSTKCSKKDRRETASKKNK